MKRQSKEASARRCLNLDAGQQVRALVPGLVLALALASACSRGLGTFGADIGKETSPMGSVRIPYATAVGYFGYLQPAAPADEVRSGRKVYYLYVWLPRAVAELGARLVSPLPKVVKPTPRDFVDSAPLPPRAAADSGASPAALATPGADAAFFDAWMSLERCPTTANADDLLKPCSQWVVLAENDDSSEMPALPSGVRGNPLLRVSSNNDDPLRALGRGLYRLTFGTTKGDEAKGSFLIQVATPGELPGLCLARSLAELHKVVAAGH